MKTNPFYALLFLLCISISLTSCGEDDEEDPARYTAKITNTTLQNVEIFIASGAGSNFVSQGIIPSGEFREYQLVLSVNYTLRASVEGESVEEYVDEHVFSNSNPEVVSLNFDIEF
jgi:hypothetical protein